MVEKTAYEMLEDLEKFIDNLQSENKHLKACLETTTVEIERNARLAELVPGLLSKITHCCCERKYHGDGEGYDHEDTCLYVKARAIMEEK